jgi:hypothetical protein
VLHIISNVNYSAQLNAVLEAMGYGLPTLKKEDSVKKAKARAPQEKSSVEHGIGLKPSVREKLEQFKAVAGQAKTPQRIIGKGKAR